MMFSEVKSCLTIDYLIYRYIVISARMRLRGLYENRIGCWLNNKLEMEYLPRYDHKIYSKLQIYDSIALMQKRSKPFDISFLVTFL